MSLKNINLKNEFIFFLKAFWTNGFSVWTVIIGMTGIFSFVPLVCDFRETLWFNQLMWVFFVPLIYQIGSRFILAPKTTKQFKTKSSKLKMLFVSFALAIIMSSVIIEYVYFAADTMLIIPEHYNEARGSNYEIVPWLKALNWIFIGIFLAGERYRKHLVKTGDIDENESKNWDTEHQIFFLSIGFTLSLSAFLLVQEIINAPTSDFCQSLMNN